MVLLAGFVVCISAQQSYAIEEWEANITVTSGSAETRFSFGQKSDATDLEDGLYDVPAMLSGDIQVYSQTREGSFWRDIRSTESGNEWQIVITSQTRRSVEISWNPDILPTKANVKLIDASDGKEVDMKSSKVYTLGTISEAILLIEVTNK